MFLHRYIHRKCIEQHCDTLYYSHFELVCVGQSTLAISEVGMKTNSDFDMAMVWWYV